jgi:hypothetical protein
MDPTGLHTPGRDGPDGRLEVDLVPGRAQNFAGARRRQDRELDGQRPMALRLRTSPRNLATLS